MLKVSIDEDNRVAILEPEESLSAGDFQAAASEIDPVIEKYGQLSGIIIRTRSFPGWESFAALTSHLRFVKNHHRHVARVALVTDSVAADFAEKIASHFVKAEIRSFSYQDVDKARDWIGENIR
ncbi:MAG: STAS/SEC14 domain-containing protein [Pseudomonadales bacterium]|nr:STAS/SEC14 domain-containing protein [Halieaceae bacterium]MCP5164142.1 STAS/SEC14 domain-containing protein [Pseudomonadales bacterium]MCP5190480.1 STAS/SEC14 domain-containing protein [Pseudomonadales bacterium]MCP5203782.1 STAS/SEC14 domain-containing protein [Pseudomonadales bacterium]